MRAIAVMGEIEQKSTVNQCVYLFQQNHSDKVTLMTATV
jgi:hypothetical protein